MERRNVITSLAVKFWGTIETPPLNNRETFRQSVIDTIMNVVKFQDATIEYIGYWPDPTELQSINADHKVYEDCVFVSLNLPPWQFKQQGQRDEVLIDEVLISDFIRIFEDKTHKHLAVNSAIFDKDEKKYQIEMTSDWKYYLKQG